MEMLFYDAQNFLCPVLLNLEPFEEKLLVFCSREEIALRKMNETGHKPYRIFAGGKSLARKT